MLVDFSSGFSTIVFTTSDTELEYYHQKVNVRDTSQVIEQLQAFQGNP